MKQRIFLLCALSLVGCSLPFSFGSSPKTIYRLTPDIAPAAISSGSGKRLAVRDVLSSGYVNSHRILFSREIGQIGNYQYAVWEELPAKQLTDLILLGVQQQRLFSAVTRTTSGALSDYQLNLELLDFTHELKNRSVHAVLHAELVELQSRAILSQRIFVVDEPVQREDAEGAVDGFNIAAQKLILSLESWLGETVGSTVSDSLPAEGEGRDHP